MSSRKKNYWPLVGLGLLIACSVGFWYAIVFIVAKSGYPFVSVMLVAIGLITVICCIIRIDWERVQNWLDKYVYAGIGIALTLVTASHLIQELQRYPSVFFALLFFTVCFIFSYNSLFPRKS